jgi:hypothetical protein
MRRGDRRRIHGEVRLSAQQSTVVFQTNPTSPILFRLALYCRCLRVFDLHPMRRTPRTIGRAKPRFDTMPSQPSLQALRITLLILELEARRTDVSRLQTVIRLCRPLRRTALLARQPCVRQFFGNCPIRVDSRFCMAHPYTDKSRRCDSHSTLEGRTERPFERRLPRSASDTS